METGFFKVSIKWNNKQFAGISNIFKALKSTIQDLRPLWKYLLPTMFMNFREIWKDGQTTWTPLSNKYKAWKMTHFPNRGILELKLNLKRSLTSLTENTINLALPKKWEFGFIDENIPYGNRHDEGDEIMPKREFMKIPKKMFIEFNKDIKKWLYKTEGNIVAEEIDANIRKTKGDFMGDK